MTAPSSEVLSAEEEGSRPPQSSVQACDFCKRRLGNEFFFSCRRCGASYCYVHMSRHQAALCARPKQGVHAPAATSAPRRVEALRVETGSQLLLAKARNSEPSANV